MGRTEELCKELESLEYRVSELLQKLRSNPDKKYEGIPYPEIANILETGMNLLKDLCKEKLFIYISPTTAKSIKSNMEKITLGMFESRPTEVLGNILHFSYVVSIAVTSIERFLGKKIEENITEAVRNLESLKSYIETKKIEAGSELETIKKLREQIVIFSEEKEKEIEDLLRKADDVLIPIPIKNHPNIASLM